MSKGKRLEFSIDHLTRRDVDLLTAYSIDDPDYPPPLIVQVSADGFLVSIAETLSDGEEKLYQIWRMTSFGHSDTFMDILQCAGSEGADAAIFQRGVPRDGRFQSHYQK